MTAPNMATITESLERSLQNCSLNQSSSDSSGGSGSGIGRTSSTPDSPENHHLSNSDDTALELNSQISLPYHWEQCLDLKTGEIYYINWRTGMRAKEDPRTTTEFNEVLYSDEDDDSSYDSEGSTSEYSPSYSRDQQQYHHNNRDDQKDHVLVVAGCKSCLMYFMVPKQVLDCPKCSGQLLHFDRSENGSP